MTLIEGIGDEVTHFFIALLVVLVVSLAWWTTSISEQRHVQTVWLLDRRRHRTHRRLTNHTHTVTIAEGTVTRQTATVEPTETPPAHTQATAKPLEASTSSESTLAERRTDDDPVNIIETMDADSCVVRQRRLAFYERNSDGENSRGESANSGAETQVDPTIMEHNYADTASNSSDLKVPSSAEQENVNVDAEKSANDIRIKLKYINDDLRLVDGKLQEQLGDFKKRHFQGELTANKLVRLIFNGQVLHQDSKTLEGCGLFDNCVVHCLIHQKRPTPGEDQSDSRSESSTANRRNTTANNNNQGRDWDLGNFLFAIISFTLLSAWYFRYVYAHLYTVTATVGLILMTGIFTIVLFGFYFPETDQIPQRVENQAQS